MRVLHLPTIPGQLATNIRALNDVGIEARGLAWIHDNREAPQNVKWLPEPLSRRKKPIRGIFEYLKLRYMILSGIKWADVIHWHTRPAFNDAYDLRYASKLGKVGIIEFWGSDIRKKSVATSNNPFLLELYKSFPELARSDKMIREKQMLFSQYGFECLIPGKELIDYVETDLFPDVYQCDVPIYLTDFDPVFPDPQKEKPLIVHAPTHKKKKGTEAVMMAIQTLRKDFDFDFQLIHGVERSQAMKMIQSSDIFLDQFVIGAEGFACLEAMAFGKPSLCYLRNDLLSRYPEDLGIIVADQNNLTEILANLLRDGDLRCELGIKGRRYIEKYHDSKMIAQQFVSIYETAIQRQKGTIKI